MKIYIVTATQLQPEYAYYIFGYFEDEQHAQQQLEFWQKAHGDNAKFEIETAQVLMRDAIERSRKYCCK